MRSLPLEALLGWEKRVSTVIVGAGGQKDRRFQHVLEFADFRCPARRLHEHRQGAGGDLRDALVVA